MPKIKVSVENGRIEVEPEHAKVPAGSSIEFETMVVGWDVGVEFDDDSPFEERTFYVDTGKTKARSLRSDKSGTFRYTVTAGERGPKSPMKRSKTAEIEIEER